MKVFFVTCCSLLAVCLSVCGSFDAAADETATAGNSKGRSVFTDDRPDDSRGWIIVTKASFWPLCYESLDRLEQTREMIGKAKPEELAETLDKCGAWLGLATSAAMTDGRSGIAEASSKFADAAESIRAGSSNWSDADLADLVVLGHLCMAKSHVLRAAAPDESVVAERTSPNVSKNPTAEQRTAAREIAQLRVERAIAQYKYDTSQSLRHLKVAQTYLKTAAEAGGLEVDGSLFTELPEPSADANSSDMVLFVDADVRPQIKQLLDAVEAHRKAIATRLSEK